MKKLTTGFVIVVLLLAGTQTLQAETQHATIQIVEFSPGNEDSASHEFIELFNPNADSIDLADFAVQYRSASGSTWLTKADELGEIAPRARRLVSTYHENEPELRSGFSATGGSVQLINTELDEIHSIVSWGSAVFDDRVGVDAPTKSQSIKRLVNEDGRFLAGNESANWFNSDEPSPESDTAPINDEDDPIEENDDEDDVDSEDTLDPIDDETESEEDSNQGESGTAIDDPIAQGGPFAAIEITELLIDPDTPLKDAEDEFIEIFNPNSAPVALAGYRLETGTSFSYSFELDGIEIEPGQYLALYAIDTGLALSNSAGAARILDPSGEVIFETPPYEKAKADTVWTRNSAGEWGWSTEQSPGRASGAVLSATATEARALERESQKSNSSSKASTAATVKSPEDGNSESDLRTQYEEPEAEQAPINVQLLAGMGGLTVLYAGYEYRTDIANRIYQARRYFRGRSKTG